MLRSYVTAIFMHIFLFSKIYEFFWLNREKITIDFTANLRILLRANVTFSFFKWISQCLHVWSRIIFDAIRLFFLNAQMQKSHNFRVALMLKGSQFFKQSKILWINPRSLCDICV